MRLLILSTLFLFFAELSAFGQNETNMKTVVLIRHSKSSHADTSLIDFDRPLNERGYRDAPFMGAKVKEMNVEFDLIISSPSKRTTESMEHFCPKAGYDYSAIQWDTSVYLSSPSNLEKIISNLPDSIHTVGIVGHNPSMTIIANKMQSDQSIENVPTSGIVSVTFDTDNWKEVKMGKGTLDFFIYPKKYQ